MRIVLKQGWNAVCLHTCLNWACILFFSRFSGPNDHVFVYFTDHGAPGLLAFPDSEVNYFPLPVNVPLKF